MNLHSRSGRFTVGWSRHVTRVPPAWRSKTPEQLAISIALRRGKPAKTGRRLEKLGIEPKSPDCKSGMFPLHHSPENSLDTHPRIRVGCGIGIEPTSSGSTVRCSAVELPTPSRILNLSAADSTFGALRAPDHMECHANMEGIARSGTTSLETERRVSR